jgi:hypothetical protein
VSETKAVTKKVTFNDGLPLGGHATFTHEGQRWIAFPAEKHWKIAAVIDRLVGIHARTARIMVSWVNSWPDDAVRVAEVMEITRRARELGRSVTMEKAEALTWRGPGDAARTSPMEGGHGPACR